MMHMNVMSFDENIMHMNVMSFDENMMHEFTICSRLTQNYLIY